ncbi:MAG: FecR domain-containing protein, partial [Sphingobacterium sp.]
TSTGWQVRTFKNKNWHNNELIHMNEPLKQVLRKAYRYFGDSVAVSGKLAKTKISISFRNKNIQQVLQTLAELSNGNLIKRNDHEWEIK